MTHDLDFSWTQGRQLSDYEAVLHYRIEFLWLVFDSIQRNYAKLDDKIEIAARLAGQFCVKNMKSYCIVSKAALESLEKLGLIKRYPGEGYRPLDKSTCIPASEFMTKEAFFEKMILFSQNSKQNMMIRSAQ